MNQDKWNKQWLLFARTAANLSKDPKTKVGAVVVTPDNRQCSIGYNGFPAGVMETEERWERPNKYEWVIHGEINAIINCPFDTKGCSIYLTHRPCHRCIGIILQSGIKRVIFEEVIDSCKFSNPEHVKIIEEISQDFEEFRQIKLP